MNEAAVLLATALTTAVGGSVAVWRTSIHRETRRRSQALWWRAHMTPNHHGELTDHTPPDVLTERPLLPKDYQ